GMGMLNQGSDFFADRVMDDPKQALFYDPQQASDASSESNVNSQNTGATSNDSGALRPINFEEQLPETAPPSSAIRQENVPAPRQGVVIEALPDLGVIVVKANNASDAEAIEQLIKIIRDLSAKS